ncbi:DUF7927 domain-containing protein [Nakamurella panacisegetis]|nr:DUF11 domain-containing protein [Nakamurella panacisegetis]
MAVPATTTAKHDVVANRTGSPTPTAAKQDRRANRAGSPAPTKARPLAGVAAPAASTATSDFSKTATNLQNNSRANSATGAQGTAQPGDTVRWALVYQNKTGADATVSVNDQITGGQTYVLNSLQTSPNFIGNVTGNTVSATGTVLSTATSGRSPTFNAAAVNFSTPGGDGYSVEGFGNSIYTVFHHNNSPTAVFCSTLTNQVCPGWPGFSTFVDPTAGTPIGQGTAGVYTTALTNGSFIENGRLYWPVSQNGANGVDPFGMQCLDLIANVSCGYNQLGTTTVPGYPLSGDGIAASDGNYYYLDLNGFLQCVSPTGTSCGAVNVAGGAPIAVAGSREVGTYGRYVYASYRGSIDSLEHLTCYDTATSAVCPGFPATVGTPGPNYDSEVFPVVSPAGTLLGACAVYNSACFDTAGNAIGNPWAGTSYSFSPLNNNGFGTGVLVGTKYYTGNGDQVDCYDFAQPLVGGKVQPCAAFTTNPPDLRSYTVRALQNLPGCMASNGDGAQISVFNAATGAPCSTASQSVKLTPTDSYCDGRSAHVQSWETVTLPGLDGSQYAGATLTLFGADGNPLPAWTNVPFPASGAQTIDISSIPVTGNTATLTAQVNIAAVSDTAAVDASRITVAWQGDPVQIACYETVIAPVACLQSSVVSNTATAVTTAGTITDGPAGNSTGPAIFNVAPSAAQCMLHVLKTGAPDPAKPGTTVTYTITVHNTGTMDYTAGDPARFTDDITDVLKDSAYNAASLTSTPGTTASYDPTSNVISWSGPLAADATATITYTVTVDSPDTGDHSMFNRVVTPSGTPANCAANSTDPDCASLVQVPDLKVSKAANPADGSAVVAGQVVTYTLTFQNIGKGTAAVDWTDDLTKVLDDATVTSAPAASNANLTVGAVTAGTFAVTGSVPAGATYTVSYQVTVKPDGQRGDNDMANFVVPTGTTPPTNCVSGDPLCTDHKIPQVSVTKSSNPVDGANVSSGDAIAYTLTFQNTGAAAGNLDYVDNLTDVLDDASITGTPVASSGNVTVGAVSGGRLPITGTIPAGATYTVTYTVTVKPFAQQGNHVLLNYVAPPGTQPPSAGTCVADPTCVTHPIPHLSIVKTASTTDRPAPGDKVTYTVTVTNDGSVDYTAGSPATMTDDLTKVLDDATYDSDAAATSGSTPSVSGNTLTWSGPLAVTQAVTITYSVTYHGTGDTIMTNTACVPKQGQDPNCDTVSVPAALITASKAVAPANGSTVVAGQVLTYTLTFANTGEGAGSISYTDDLSKVLDDASLTSGPTASNAALTVGSVTTGKFQVFGVVPGKTSYTVTYTVTVKPDGQRGDNALDNFLFPTGTTPPVSCDPADPLCTHNPVSQIVPSKSVDPKSGSVVTAGQVLTYTLGFHNTGAVAGSVDYTDDLTGVLDDATLTSAPAASNTHLTIGAVTGGTFQITGTVPVGATYTVTYRVTVKPDGHRGNDTASNFLTRTGGAHGSTCGPKDPLCTTNPMPDVIEWKTVDPTTGTTVDPGQTLTYTLHYHNIGAAAGAVNRVDDITQLVDDAAVTSQPVTSNPALKATAFGSKHRSAITGTLAAGQTVTITYRVKVANPDHGDGQLANFLLKPTDPPSSSPKCTPADPQHPTCTVNPVNRPGTPHPGISLLKTADKSVIDQVGELVTYSFKITNTGNITLHNTAVQEGTFTGTGQLSAISCPAAAASLAPSASVTCTATYVATQADVDAGTINNTAAATGTPTGGTALISNPSKVVVLADTQQTPPPPTVIDTGNAGDGTGPNTGMIITGITILALVMLGGAAWIITTRRTRRKV